MNRLNNLLRESSAFQQLRRRLDVQLRSSTSDREPILLTGVHGAAHAFLLSTLRFVLPEDAVLVGVFPSQAEARKAYHDLFAFGTPNVGFFPLLPDILGEGGADSHKSLRAERIEALDLIHRGGTVIAPIHALSQRVPPLDGLLENTLRMEVGELYDFGEIVGILSRTGYRRVETVELKGEFAVRGGIIDVFPLTESRPIRMEFFGDTLESLRRFDETTQRSIEPLRAIRLVPPREFALTEETRRTWIVRTNARYSERPSRRLRAEIEELTDQLFETGMLAEVERYYPLLFEETTTLADALPENAILYLDETNWMKRELQRFHEKVEALADDAKEAETLWVHAREAFLAYEEVIERLKGRPTIEVGFAPTPEASSERLSLHTQPIVEHKGSLQQFLKGMRHWNDEGYSVAIISESAKAGDQMLDVLRDHDLLTPYVSSHVGWLSEGFESEALRVVVIAQEAIFGRQSRVPHRQSRFRDGRPLLSLVDLQEGDFVVHVTHGIGRYRGIRRLKVGEEEHDFLALQYAGSDVLYVPTYNINLVQKYIGPSGEKGPSLDRIGGASWNRVKSRVKKSVEDLAKELLELYAARETTPGHAFAPDTAWQTEFEAAFSYEETPDQLRAIEEVKRDLEQPHPMDRLICGDVGYGKTEVAMRAACKVVTEGMQVAVLVPTTVLAQQHYFTFTERFREFPVQIRMLSRLSSPKEVQRTLKMLADGTADIVIGTHRLLSKDVRFRALGLLVVDEEHRFGVRQKERLKQLKKQVDTMTLTATPIPRTLHMAMTGVRDLTVITTPPENRLPIETYVTAYRADVVREAILRELARGGQVFFVHNRVRGIESIAENIGELVPQARIGVAHGQMSERALEDVMLRFVRHEFDVLVCTTIIESGLDIPNVNTILINRADALGLAQLYQLRGRVGRSDRRAYGYLFYAEDRAMSEASQKRLRVIEEFTELGAGFKIALHDMEIRGAGNLLGPEQHGQIAAVGYDLYCKLLENAIAELKGEEIEEEIETRVVLPISAYVPEEYVRESAAKMALYKRMSQLRSREDRDRIEAEMRDRYGPLPEPALHLLETAYLKSLAARLGITDITVSDGRVVAVFDEDRARVEPEAVLSLMRRMPGVRLVPPSRLMVPVESEEPQALFGMLHRLFEELDPDGQQEKDAPSRERTATR